MLALERMVIYMNLKPMLNAYPDSLGGTLGDIVTLLKQDDMKGVFGSFYILPSLYHSDLDRGFSVIDYDINEELADGDLSIKGSWYRSETGFYPESCFCTVSTVQKSG